MDLSLPGCRREARAVIPPRADPDKVSRYVFHAEDCLLLVVDIQESLRLTVDPRVLKDVIGNVRSLVEVGRSSCMGVVVGELDPHRNGRTVGELDDVLGDTPRVPRSTLSCWVHGRLRSGIRAAGKRTVLVTGAQAHLSVLRTVTDLLLTGHNPVVVADAVCSANPLHHALALTAMAGAGAVVYPAETVLWMLADDREKDACCEASFHPRVRPAPDLGR